MEWFDRVVDLLGVVGGARRDVLGRVPEARGHAALLGVILLLTATIASLTCGYALSRVFLDSSHVELIAILGGPLWGAAILTIDSLLIRAIDRFASPWRLTTAFAARVPFAFVIALVMSMPLVLRIASPTLEAELRRQERNQLSSETRENAAREQLSDRQSALDTLKRERREQDRRLQGAPDSFAYKRARERAAVTETQLRRVESATWPKLSRIQAELAALADDSGPSPLSQRRREALEAQLKQLRSELAAAQRAARSAAADEARARDEWVAAETARADSLEKELRTADGAHQQASARVVQRNSDSEERLNRETRPNLVNQYRTLRRITEDPKHADSAALRSLERGLHLLLFLLEVAPLLLKVSGKLGPLDHAARAVEFEEEERINVGTNTEVLRIQKLGHVAAELHELSLSRLQEGIVAGMKANTVRVQDVKRLEERLRELTA